MMKEKLTTVLTGIGHHFPETVLDNKFFENLDIGTDSDWIEQRTGIVERRSILQKEDIIDLRYGRTTYAKLRAENKILPITEMAKFAWNQAYERSGTASHALKIDNVISGTSTPDFDTPAHACAIACELKLECSAFDLNSACSSFVLGMHIIRAMVNSGFTNKVALFTSDRLTVRNDYSDRSNCIIFGDCCTAAILEKYSGQSGLEIIDTIVGSDPSGFSQIRLGQGETFNQNGATVQKFAIGKTVSVTEEILNKNNLKAQDIKFFISHQANLRMLAGVVKRLGFTDDQHLYSVDRYGNQGAAGAPAVLSMNWEKIQTGDLVIVTVVGGGLSWGSALLRKV